VTDPGFEVKKRKIFKAMYNIKKELKNKREQRNHELGQLQSLLSD
jgi:hypothetical protein